MTTARRDLAALHTTRPQRASGPPTLVPAPRGRGQPARAVGPQAVGPQAGLAPTATAPLPLAPLRPQPHGPLINPSGLPPPASALTRHASTQTTRRIVAVYNTGNTSSLAAPAVATAGLELSATHGQGAGLGSRQSSISRARALDPGLPRLSSRGRAAAAALEALPSKRQRVRQHRRFVIQDSPPRAAGQPAAAPGPAAIARSVGPPPRTLSQLLPAATAAPGTYIRSDGPGRVPLGQGPDLHYEGPGPPSSPPLPPQTSRQEERRLHAPAAEAPLAPPAVPAKTLPLLFSKPQSQRPPGGVQATPPPPPPPAAAGRRVRTAPHQLVHAAHVEYALQVDPAPVAVTAPNPLPTIDDLWVLHWRWFARERSARGARGLP